MPIKPWSDNPYAPKIQYSVYLWEKENFAGIDIGAISYGIVVVLFFRCMFALLDPTNRKKGGIKWPLVIHTVVMFLFVTVFTVQSIWVQSVSYIDDRDFDGNHKLIPGPFSYEFFTLNRGVGLFPTILIYVNTWLADGLLLYRCYAIYAMNCWAVALPFLMYLALIAMSIGYTYQILHEGIGASAYPAVFNFGTPFYSISLSLCVLLTLMIVVRLVLHGRNIRNVMGPQGGTSGLYTAIYTMLIESYALYVVNFVLFIGTWGANNGLQYTFFQVLAETQVIAPFLVTIRVANRTALTNDAIVTGNLSSIHYKSHGKSTGYTETLPESSIETPSGESRGELVIGAESGIDEVPSSDCR